MRILTCSVIADCTNSNGGDNDDDDDVVNVDEYDGDDDVAVVDVFVVDDEYHNKNNKLIITIIIPFPHHCDTSRISLCQRSLSHKIQCCAGQTVH